MNTCTNLPDPCIGIKKQDIGQIVTESQDTSISKNKNAPLKKDTARIKPKILRFDKIYPKFTIIVG